MIVEWVSRKQQEVVDYLEAENQVLREHQGSARLRLIDAHRCLMARLSRRVLDEEHFMSDDRLRALERRWRVTRILEHEAAWLLERVRAGELAQDKLELAALCGHEGARHAISEQKGVHPSPLAAHRDKPRPSDRPAIEAYLSLTEWGREAGVRAALAAAKAGIAMVQVDLEALTGPVVAALEKWVSSPCDEYAAEAMSLLSDVPSLDPDRDGESWPVMLCYRACQLAVGGEGVPFRVDLPGPDGARIDQVCSEAICQALCSWCLGK